MSFQFGIDVLLQDDDRLATLSKARVGLVAHPASITGTNQHSIDALIAAGNSADTALVPAVRNLLSDEQAIVRGAAIWALSRLDRRAFAEEKAKHHDMEADAQVREEWSNA